MKTSLKVVLVLIVLLVAWLLVRMFYRESYSPYNPAPSSSYPTASSSGTPNTTIPSSVPAQYKDLYDKLQGNLNNYDKQITAKWDGSAYPVNYATVLISANSQKGPGVLQAGIQAVKKELDGDQLLGVKAVMVEIGFPTFDKNYYASVGQSTNLAQQFTDYYVSVAQEIHNRGMKMIVEANPVFSIGGFSSLNPGAYYQSLSWSQYISLRSAHNIIVAQQIKPDYLILQSEPDTDVTESHNYSIAVKMKNPVTDTQMISQFVTDLNNAKISGLHSSVKIGSGMGTWQSNWQQYLSGLTAIAGLDSIDSHVYFLGDPQSNDEISIAMQMADQIHAAGKTATMAEFWPHKTASPYSAIMVNSPTDDINDIRARDNFSFWTPLDQQFLLTMIKLANYEKFEYFSTFAALGKLNWAYLDYDKAPCTPAPGDLTCDASIQKASGQVAGQALLNHQLSPLGNTYKDYIAAHSK